MKEIIEQSIRDSIRTKEIILSNGLVSKIEKGAQWISGSYQKKGKLLLCGNGGSAADAQHIAAELVGRFGQDRRSLPAIALNTNTSTLSSIGNDFSFDDIFARQIEGFMNKEDILIAISTSGNSSNIVKAVQAAKEKGGRVIGLTGEDGGQLKDQVDLLLNIPSKQTPRIQESHILVGHILCDLVEQELFS